MFQKLTKIITAPFPYNRAGKSYLYFPPMIIMILMMFHPFGLDNIEPIYLKYIVEFGYGIVTFFMLFFNTVLLPKLFPDYFIKERWTVLKEILLTLLIVITISFGNTLYTFLGLCKVKYHYSINLYSSYNSGCNIPNYHIYFYSKKPLP